MKGKGVDRESVDLGPEVSSSQSVHLRSTPLPSSFFKQDLGHAVSTTTPSSFAQTQLSIGPSEDSKAGSPSTDNSLTSTLVERQSTTPVQSRPPTTMSQRAFEDDDLGTPHHSAQTRMPSVQDPSLAHQSYEHSQPLPSQSYQPLPSQPLPSHEHVYHTAMPGPSSSRRVPGTYTLPEDRMDSPPSTTTIPPRFAARRPVRIKPQGRFELFNGIDVERFIRRWESVGEIQEASDLDLVKQIPFFVASEDIRREVEDMSGYVEQNWGLLKEEMISRWGLLEPEYRYTIGHLEEFCRKIWASGGVAHRDGYQKFRQTFDVMAAYLVKHRHVDSEEWTTTMFYRAFSNAKKAEIKKWLVDKELMVLTTDGRYRLPVLRVLKQAADAVIRADIVLSFEEESSQKFPPPPSRSQYPSTNPLPPARQTPPHYNLPPRQSYYTPAPPRPPIPHSSAPVPPPVPYVQDPGAFRTYREAPASVSSQGDINKKVDNLTQQMSLLAARIPSQPNPPPPPPAPHARSSSRDNPPFSCYYCQEGAHVPARCQFLQDDISNGLVSYEKGAGYTLPGGAQITHDVRRPIRSVVLKARNAGNGMRVTTVKLTDDPPTLGASSMIARLQSLPSAFQPVVSSSVSVVPSVSVVSSSSVPVVSSSVVSSSVVPVVSPAPIELSSVSAFPILAGNDVHVNAITRSGVPGPKKSAFANKKKGKKPDKEEESRIEELPDEPTQPSSSSLPVGPEVRSSITTNNSAMDIDTEHIQPAASIHSLPPLAPPSLTSVPVLSSSANTTTKKASMLASPSSTAVQPGDEDELDELEIGDTSSSKLPRAIRPRFERPVAVAYPDATDSLVQKILALKLPDIAVGEVVSVAPALAEALKFQFSRHRKNEPLDLSINAVAFKPGFGGLVNQDNDDEDDEETFKPLFACPLGFLQCLFGLLLVPMRPLVDNGAQINVICSTLTSALGITSWVDVRFTVKAFGGTACRIIGVVEDFPVQVGKISGTVTLFISNNRQGDCLLGLPFLCDFSATLEFSPVSQNLSLRGEDGRPVKFQLASISDGCWYRSLLEWTRASKVSAVLSSVGIEHAEPVSSGLFVEEDVRYACEDGVRYFEEDARGSF